MKVGLTADELAMMHRVFAQFPQIESVILFGSRAMLNHKVGSDVDLLLAGKVDHSLRNEVHAQLEEEIPLPYFFDVLIESELSKPGLKQHIEEHGKVIYSR